MKGFGFNRGTHILVDFKRILSVVNFIILFRNKHYINYSNSTTFTL